MKFGSIITAQPKEKGGVMTKNRIDLCIARQNFSILCDEDPEYMRRLETSVNNRINTYQRLFPTMSTSKCALLAMLSLEDELQKTRTSYEALEEKVFQIGGLNNSAVQKQE